MKGGMATAKSNAGTRLTGDSMSRILRQDHGHLTWDDVRAHLWDELKGKLGEDQAAWIDKLGPFGNIVKTKDGWALEVDGHRLDLATRPDAAACATWTATWRLKFALADVVLKLNGQAAYIEQLEQRIHTLEKMMDELALMNAQSAPTWNDKGPLTEDYGK